MSQHYYAAVEGRVLNPTLRLPTLVLLLQLLLLPLLLLLRLLLVLVIFIKYFCNCHVQDCSASYKLEDLVSRARQLVEMLEPVPNFKP